mgnify:CR=1 FL=1
MEQNTELINIYLKIHQKRDLTLDDLRYLAYYDRECFEKTCKNVVYNIPQAKPIVLQEEAPQLPAPIGKTENKNMDMKYTIDQIIDNLRYMEAKQIPVADFDVERVKNLLGNLYMELLFPHNDRDSFFSVEEEDRGMRFDKKA